MIRRIRESEHGLVRALRLQALRDAPDAFSDTLEKEAERPESYWVELTRSLTTTHAMFVAEVDGRARGSVYGLRDVERPEGSRVGGMWVATPFRRHGLGRALLAAVLDWARAEGCTSVRLWAPARSPEALGLYEGSGFVFTGERKVAGESGSLAVREMVLETAPLAKWEWDT
jgi:GNAT superfamily N-acetyltransferase